MLDNPKCTLCSSLGASTLNSKQQQKARSTTDCCTHWHTGAMGGGEKCGLSITAHTYDETDGVGAFLEGVGNVITDIVDMGEDGAKRVMETLPLPWSSAEKSDEGEVGNTVFVSGRSTPRRFGVHLVRQAEGHKIAKVFEKSLAHKAQLRESDIITHLNGVEIGSENLIKVHKLFLDVEGKFSLKILRKVEIGGNSELIEHEIFIKFESDTADVTVDVVVTSSGLRVLPATVIYQITQDRNNEPQVFLQVNARTGRIAMREKSESRDSQDEFELVPVVYYRIFPAVTLYVLRNASTKKALSNATMQMECFDESAVEDFLFDKINLRNSKSVFRRIESPLRSVTWEQDQGGHLLNNVNGDITLTYFENLRRVAPTCLFQLHEAI